jgi:hypothetical protein
MSIMKGGDSHAPITPKKEGIKRMNLNVPSDTHRAFKAATAAEGKEMSEVLIAFIKDYIRQHAPALPPAKKGGR